MFNNKVYVRMPESHLVRRIIDKLSRYVVSDGYVMEHTIMEKERDNPDFSFLFAKGSDENIYYRWRVYSLANGDTDKDWRLDPFRIYEYGPLWYPPPNIEEKEKKKQATGSQRLSEEKREEIEDMLRNLTTERRSISEAMAFCLDHGEHSAEIVHIMTESLANHLDIPVAKKIARLYLINDILYNSSLLHVPAAWSFRKFFEPKLPEIFEQLSKTKNSLKDAHSADLARDKIMKVLKIWNDWAIYDLKFLLGLEASFAKKANPFGSSSSSQRGHEDRDKTNFIKETSEIGLKLRFVEEKLNKDSSKELEKFCRQNGLLATGGRADLIERILVLREYEMKTNNDEKNEGGGAQLETVEKKKIDISVELIKDYNRFLSTKQPQNLGLHEIDKLISGGVELLNFIQARNDKIDEDDYNGQQLDEFDIALYGLPAEEDFDIDKLEEKDLPSGINLDGEPLSKSELRELERLENKPGSEDTQNSRNNRDKDRDRRSRSPKNKRDKSKERERDRSRERRDRSDSRKQKKYSKRYSSSSSRSKSYSSRSKSDSRSRSRSKSPSRKGSKKNNRRR